MIEEMRKIGRRKPAESFREIALGRIGGIAQVIAKLEVARCRSRGRHRDDFSVELARELPRLEILIAAHGLVEEQSRRRTKTFEKPRKGGGTSQFAHRRASQQYAEPSNPANSTNLTNLTNPTNPRTERTYEPTYASASISTSICGSMRRGTSTIAVAGRVSTKNSPCALPTFSQFTAMPTT